MPGEIGGLRTSLPLVADVEGGAVTDPGMISCIQATKFHESSRLTWIDLVLSFNSDAISATALTGLLIATLFRRDVPT